MTSTYGSPPPRIHRIDDHGRRDGFVAGLIVSTLIVASFTPGRGAMDGSGLSLDFAAAMVIAGSVGGWLFGPPAMRATTGAGWAGIVVGLSMTAVVAGAAVVTLPVALQIASLGNVGALESLIEVGQSWAALTIVGTLVMLVPSLFITLPPAVVWVAMMAIRRGQLDGLQPAS